MENATFTFAGTNSSKYGVWVQTRPTRKAAQRNFMSGNASNRSGTTFRDGVVYLNSTLTLECAFKYDATTYEEIFSWLDGGEYQDLYLWYDEKYKYKALISDVIETSPVDAEHTVYTFNLVLSLYPFKYDTSDKSMDFTIGPNESFRIDNTKSHITAKPSMTITKDNSAKSDVTIKIGVKQFKFTNVEPGQVIYIDSSIPMCNKPSQMVGLGFPEFDNSMVLNVSIPTHNASIMCVGNPMRRVV